MTTVYTYDPTTLKLQGEYSVPKGLHGEDLFPVHYSVDTPPAFDADTQECLMQNGTWAVQDIPSVVPTLTQSQSEKYIELSIACQKAIISGFSSSALGSATNYPSMPIDQCNQQAAALVGGNLQCEQASIWALRKHTAAQAIQVVTDFMTWLNKCQNQYVILCQQVNNLQDSSIIATVDWIDPT